MGCRGAASLGGSMIRQPRACMLFLRSAGFVMADSAFIYHYCVLIAAVSYNCIRGGRPRWGTMKGLSPID